MKYLLEGQESERLLFRKLAPEDFDTWVEFAKDPESTRYAMFEGNDPPEKCRLWFAKVFARYQNDTGGTNILIDKETGAIIGHCGLLVQTLDEEEELGIGYSILPVFRNKGFATEAARKCIDFAFENKFSNSLISIIHVDNIKSEKVAIQSGMALEKTTIFKDAPVNVFRIRCPLLMPGL